MSKVQTRENSNYVDYEEKKLQEIFNMVHGILSDMDLIWRLGIAQSDVYSHKMLELSAVESSI